MHKGVRRGYLQQASGKPFTHEQIARGTGCSSDEVSRLLRELIDSGTASVTDTGVIFSRRIVREQQLSEIRIAAGKKGGNPVLVNQTDNQTSTKVPTKPLASEYLDSLDGNGGLGEREGEICAENPSCWLGRIWNMHTKRTKNGCKQDQAEDASPVMNVLLKSGWSEKELEHEIINRLDDTEYLWQFKERLLKAKKKVKEERRGRTKKDIEDDQEKERLERAARNHVAAAKP